jgi:hypothetical protein
MKLTTCLRTYSMCSDVRTAVPQKCCYVALMGYHDGVWLSCIYKIPICIYGAQCIAILKL